MLEMNITRETYRGISQEFGYSEDSWYGHLLDHLTVDLGDIEHQWSRPGSRL